MSKRRLRQTNSPKLSVRTAVSKRAIIAFSIGALVAAAAIFIYSNFFSSSNSRAGGRFSENSDNQPSVHLAYFRATANPSSTVLLEWAALAEIGKDYYSIDRSADGTEFSPIGLVQVDGNSSSQRAYTYVDTDPLDGTNYYRLRLTDHKGWSDFFETVPFVIVTKTDAVARMDVNSWDAGQ